MDLGVDGEVQVVIQQAGVLRPQVLKGVQFARRGQRHAVALVLAVHGVDALVEGDFQQLEQVDAGVGGAGALAGDDVLAAAEGHILLRRLLVHPHGIGHRGHVHVVVVQGGIGGPAAQRLQGGVPDLLRHILGDPQGELGLHIAQFGGRPHGEPQEHVRLAGVLAAVAAHDDPPVDGGAAVFDHPPQALDVLVGLGLGEAARFQVRRKVGPQQVVQAAVVDDPRHQRVQPEQLQSLREGFRRAVLDVRQHAGHGLQLGGAGAVGGFGRLQRLAAQMLRAGAEQVQRLPGSLVELVFAVGRRALVDARAQTVHPAAEQDLVVQHHAGQPRRGDERRFTVNEAADHVVDQHLVAVDGLAVVVQPVLIQPVQLLLFRFGGQALPHGFQLAEHAVVAHAAQGGHAAEADGQKVQPAQEQIARLHPAQQRGIQHPQAAHLPLLLA